MIARGFRSVGWVAAVGGAALCCYMLSLQVATERSDLARIEARIVATKQQIRSLQTELGTRGRLSQLEQWNSDVLALAAPASGQFLRDEFTLARLDRRDPTLAERAPVRMASLETAAAPPPAAAAPAPDAKSARAVQPQAPPAGQIQPAIVRRASFTGPQLPATPAALETKPARRLDAKLAEELGVAARAEKPRAAPTRTSTARGDRPRAESARADAGRVDTGRAASTRSEADRAKPGAGGAGTR